MEALIQFITSGAQFWTLLLVVTFLLNKNWRIGGVIILMVLIFNETIPFWLLAIIVIITLFTNYLRPYNLFKNRYEKKCRSLYGTRRIKENQ